MAKFMWLAALLGSVGLAASSGVLQGGTAAAADKPIVLRLAHINANTDPKQKEAERFKELVEQKTGGRVKVEVYGAGVLGDVREIIEGLQLGTDEVVIEGFGTLGSYTKLSLLDLVPFMFRDRTHFDKVWDGELGKKLLAEAGAQSKMKLFGPSYRGVRVTTSTKRFSNLKELKGLKIRVPADDMSVKTWQALGATPTPMAMTEVLTALQQGTVDAQENPPILSYNFGLADVCKNLIRTDHRWSADVFMMDQAYFEKLPKDIQTAIVESGEEAARFTSKAITDSEDENLKKWTAAGATIVAPQLDEFRAATAGLVKTSFPELSDWVEKIKAVP